jgi:predicted DCC family thiol-disulfide oxidoreductase YuxK
MILAFYDANCAYCLKTINRLKYVNKDKRIRFHDRSELGNFIKNKTDLEFSRNLDSIILYENLKIRYYSDAVIRLFFLTGGIYKLSSFVLYIVPRFLRDWGYKTIASNRFRLSCKIHI